MSPTDQDSVADSGNSAQKNLKKHSESKRANQPAQPPQHKKRVRRRMHTSRPYQERLLNMAEARREIVTALKHHRAAMKQASEQQRQAKDQQLPLSPNLQPSHLPCVEQDGIIKCRRNLRVNPSSSNHLENYSFSPFSHAPIHVANAFRWSAASPLLPENPNFILPNQRLGLNLNFHDFNNLGIMPYRNCNSTSLQSASSPSLSSSPPPPPPPYIATYPEVSSVSQGEGSPALADSSQDGAGLHAAVDDEDIAEIRSIGEQHQMDMEWNDTMKLNTSVWWFKFLKSMEIGTPAVKAKDDSCHGFEVMEFPSWLNANESEEQCSDAYLIDPSLPCMDMDIDDIEGLDGNWWA